MNYIYKYRDVDSANKILSNNMILLNNPQNYNDPFDTIIDIDDEQVKKSLEIIGEYYLTKEFIKLLNNENIKCSLFTKLIMKWDNFLLQKIYLKINKRNKYYDSIPVMRGLSKWMLSSAFKISNENYDELKEKFSQEIIEKIKEVRNIALISCFSERWDSILMWSHYANKHCGVCIEYEKPEYDFSKVVYSKNRSHFNIEDTTRRILGYKLSEDEIYVTDEKLIKHVMRPFLTKSLDWKYEKEIRCIYSYNSNNVTYDDSIKKYFVQMPKPTKIFIGVNCSVEDRKNVIKICRERNIEYVILEKSDREYKVLRKREDKVK